MGKMLSILLRLLQLIWLLLLGLLVLFGAWVVSQWELPPVRRG